MRTLIKKWLGRALGKSGPPVVAVFLSGDQALSRSMALQLRALVPDRPHVIVTAAAEHAASLAYAEEVIIADPGRPLACWLELRRRLGRRWIALAPFIWQDGSALRWMPWLLAPRKLLAFNGQLERHHLRPTTPIASWRFLRGRPVGDIFRPTAFAGVRKLPALIGFPLLLACWAIVQIRRRRAAPLAGPQPAEPGLTVLPATTTGEELDRAVAESRFDRILVGSTDFASALAAALEDPGVWLAYAGEKFEGEAMAGESGTWSLCHRPTAVMLRRHVYLSLGGLARLERSYSNGAWLALSLVGWQRGHRTVFGGAGEGGQPLPHGRGPEPIERVVLGSVSDFRTAAKILWPWSWRWRHWNAALAALNVRPAPPPPGPASRDFLPLLDPGLHVFRGRRPAHTRRIAVVSPYLPFPLSHGGAIRIYNLLRAAAEEAEIYLFAFAEKETGREVEPLLAFCAQIVLVRTPRWDPAALFRLLPRGVAKFRSTALLAAVSAVARDQQISIAQIEYTQLAHVHPPLKTILVEHDVTFDLHRQMRLRARGWARIAARLEEARWRRYELGHARRFDRVIAMSDQDRDRLLRAGLVPERLAVVENGVDLDRFQPAPPPELPAELLFIGSFRHFPNVMAFRFFAEGIWPALRNWHPDLKLTVVAGVDSGYYWRLHTGADLPAAPPGIELLDFVEDVRPLYRRATVVIVPLVVSAGTNIKVLEALAMGRPLVSTTVGAAGLGLTSGENVLLADSAGAFASAILGLLSNEQAREEMAARGRAFVEAHYDWKMLARKLVRVWSELT